MRLARGQRFAGLLAIALAACSSSPTPGGSVVRGQSATRPTAAPTPVGGAGADFDSDNPFGPAKITPMTGGPTAGAGLKDGQCARQDLTTMRVVPTIWLVLDGSGSMVEMLGDKSRFAALKEALMDPMTGVVKSLEHDVKWGMVMYDGPGGGGMQPLPDGGVATFSSPPATTCPRLVTVEPKRDNFADINAMYPPDPLGGTTPTDKALLAVVAHLPNGSQGPVLDGRVSPTIVVLATDGAPNDFCSMDMAGGGFAGLFGGGPKDVRPQVIAAVKQLADVSIKTYVISLAGDDMMLTQHLIDVAAAGKTGKAPFIPMNKVQLVQTFKDIIGPEVACDVVLTGKVKPGLECMGTLQINGKVLACNSDNGWKLKDTQTISITGDACTTYKNDMAAVLHADFPCEVLVLN